jgi:hypothetical protein
MLRQDPIKCQEVLGHLVAAVMHTLPNQQPPTSSKPCVTNLLESAAAAAAAAAGPHNTSGGARPAGCGHTEAADQRQ